VLKAIAAAAWHKQAAREAVFWFDLDVDDQAAQARGQCHQARDAMCKEGGQSIARHDQLAHPLRQANHGSGMRLALDVIAIEKLTLNDIKALVRNLRTVPDVTLKKLIVLARSFSK